MILSEGLEHHPDSPGLNYQLACYNALAGRGDDAIEHLKVAIAGPDPRVKDWAADDEDLDSIRDREDWPLWRPRAAGYFDLRRVDLAVCPPP